MVCILDVLVGHSPSGHFTKLGNSSATTPAVAAPENADCHSVSKLLKYIINQSTFVPVHLMFLCHSFSLYLTYHDSYSVSFALLSFDLFVIPLSHCQFLTTHYLWLAVKYLYK
jgi:hypothetical protein